jgi:peroxiredoxin Q/BCP
MEGVRGPSMKAPDFTLKDQDGFERTLTEYDGRWVVLYFYPKDDTPGCTTEACSFRDARDLIAELGNAVVIGVSRDSVAKHRKFADKHDLRFTLLSDPEAETIKAYGAWGDKKFMGREFEGIKRNTYIISPKGEIVKTYEDVKPQDHALAIIDDLKSLQQST